MNNKEVSSILEVIKLSPANTVYHSMGMFLYNEFQVNTENTPFLFNMQETRNNPGETG